MSDQVITLPLKRFLMLADPPPEFRACDLYLFRDDEVVFYVGQSANPFKRVWEHLLGGFKGRSAVGRLILLNWPRSMNFVIELQNSQSARFASVGHDPGAAERLLIEELSPCFNDTLNPRPTPLPERYVPLNATVPRPRSPKRMIHDAERAVRREENRESWSTTDRWT